MAGRRGEQRTISGAKLRPRDLAAQNLELVVQDQQLDVLDVQATRTPNQRAEQSPERHVEEGEGHGRRCSPFSRKRGRDTNTGALHDRVSGARLDHRGTRYSALASAAPSWPLSPQPLAHIKHVTAAKPADDGLDTGIWIAIGGAALLAIGSLGLVGRKRLGPTRQRQPA